MNLQPVSDPDDPRLEPYRAVRERDLVGRRGLFIAEGRLVVTEFLTKARFRALSVLVTEPALGVIAPAVRPGLPVLLVTQKVMDEVTGFSIHRGCLALGERGDPHAPTPAQLLASIPPGAPACVLVLEELFNHDNIGGVFRNALAFGAAGVLLSPGCADPLYRKAIRVSMGAALRVPFARDEAWPASLDALRRAGFTVIGLTPGAGAIAIDHAAVDLPPARRVALVLGSEGDGLSARALRQCDTLVRIPMAPGVDSLNASAASAVALHRLAVPLE